jgi:Cu-Zn family superoxide dismutase
MRSALSLLVVGACVPAKPPVPGPAATVTAQRARVDVRGKKVSGHVFITNLGGAVKAQGSLQDLPPKTTFALHVHEGSDCKASGEDFNPANNTHGGPADSQSHMGDLGNITAGTDGQAVVSLIKPGPHLDNGPKGILGRVLVVHERFDDYKTQPDGDAGKTIACGVITPE